VEDLRKIIGGSDDKLREMNQGRRSKVRYLSLVEKAKVRLDEADRMPRIPRRWKRR
jgi:hypothetical protein